MNFGTKEAEINNTIMETGKLSLASLKDKVSNALSNKITEKKSRKNKNDNSKKKKGKADVHSTDFDALRREALELGATDEDLKLISGIEDADNLSEQEFDGDGDVDKNLSIELNAFMKSIGLGSNKAKDIEIADEEEDNVPDLVEEKSEHESETESGSEPESSFEEEKEEEEPHIPEHEEEHKAESNSDSEAASEPETQPSLEGGGDRETKKANPDKITNLQSVISDRLTVEPRSDWYNIPLNIDTKTADRYIKQQNIDELYEKAKGLIEEENRIYDEEFNKSSSQKRFLSQILTSGTLSDKISALTLLVQEAPLHNLRALDNLFSMCQKKSRTAAMQCIDAVVDLLVNTILPPDRKLKPFKKQPLSLNLTNEQLILMYFEDHLKTLYFNFISLLEKLSHDSILYVRMKVVSHIFSLLKAKPEQEANLLRLGVNKLGDVDAKVSSKTSYQILLTEQDHPAMKQIICEAVIDVVFRSNNDHHAVYYSINTLNQTILTKRDEGLANKLLDAYFALFEKLLVKTDSANVGQLKESEYQKEGKRKGKFKRGKKGGKSVKAKVKDETEILEEKNSKMFAAILTGLNRAFPFSNFPVGIFENHLNILYKITHGLNFNTSVQALILIHTITSKFADETHKDRFFRTLYESLWDERLLTSSKQGIYLNLLYKALKNDDKVERVLAFVKRICQVCLSWLNIGTVAGMIFLLIQLEREVPQIRNLFLNTPMDDEINKLIEQEENLDEVEQKDIEKRLYDSKKRDPKFANADNSSLWEIEYFTHHYHPTVQAYANNFLKYDELTKIERKAINKPDLGLYSLAHFLDRFIYKKPKSKANLKGSSIMQPLGGSHTGNLLVRATGVESSEVPANTEDWLSKKASQIKPEDEFFYQYFSTKQEKISRSRFDKEMEDKAKDDFEEDSELEEDAVWDALVASNPNIEGDDEEDDFDDELSDLDMSDFSDDEDDGEENAVSPDIENEEEEIGEIDSQNEEEDGLVTIKTIGDFDAGSDSEEIGEEEENNNDTSDGEDVNILMEEEDDDMIDSDDEITESDKKSRKRKAELGSEKKNKKIKLKSLPTFASAEDYAEYLQSSDEE